MGSHVAQAHYLAEHLVQLHVQQVSSWDMEFLLQCKSCSPTPPALMQCTGQSVALLAETQLQLVHASPKPVSLQAVKYQ